MASDAAASGSVSPGSRAPERGQALRCRAEDFCLPPDVHYLNGAYMSPLPHRAAEAAREGVGREEAPNRMGPDDFFRDSDRVRELFSGLVGAGAPDRIAIVPSVSYGVSICARNLQAEPGSNLVVAEEQFPSNVYAWRRLCRERGLELRTVGPGDGAFEERTERWNRNLREAVDDCTAAVALAPIQWTDGTLFDLESMGERCREVGAALVVDGTQSVGALPFDVGRVRPDALICAAYKWLLGPYGMALAYLGPRFDDGVPLEETWLGRAGSEDLAGLTKYTDRYGPGAVRYDVGERSSPILLPALAASLELLERWRPGRIQAYCQELTRELVVEARQMGFRVAADDGRASHLFGLRLQGGMDPAALRDRLAERDVAVSVRGTALRVSPNVYNDEEDVAALLRALRDATK